MRFIRALLFGCVVILTYALSAPFLVLGIASFIGGDPRLLNGLENKTNTILDWAFDNLVGQGSREEI